MSMSPVDSSRYYANDIAPTPQTVTISPSTPGLDHDYETEIYFSDSYFEASSYEYNAHLSTASVLMCSASIPSNVEYQVPAAEWYTNQPNNLENFFTTIGFEDFKANDAYKAPSTITSIGLGLAKKEITTSSGNYTLIAGCPRSGEYFKEWASNFTLGDGTKTDYIHEGWYNAALTFIQFMKDYVEEENITGNVKVWLSGFSRGGATANITAGLLDNQLNNNEKVFGENVNFTKDDLYTYTFEAPQGANVNSKNIKQPKDALYNNIFNIVNPNDVVTKVAMSNYGFTRFGVEKFVTTKFYDPDNFTNNRKTMLKLYESIDPDVAKYTGDDLTVYTSSFVNSMLSVYGGTIGIAINLANFLKVDKTKKNYDSNIVCNLFIDEFTRCMGSRSDYAKKYEPKMISIADMLFDTSASLGDFIPGVTSSFLTTTILLLPTAILAYIVSGNKTVFKIPFFASQFVSDDQTNERLESFCGLLADVTVPLASAYWEKPNELIAIIMNMSSILQNHYTEVSIAHMMAQDSYYIDAYNKENTQETISLVPLRSNADYVRMHLFGYNDIGLRLDSKKGKRIVNINGHAVGASDIDYCRNDCACGYYSYATEEKLEVFCPVGRKYNISMKSYSKKPWHRCEYWAYYTYLPIGSKKVMERQIGHHKESYCFNSDREKYDIDAR
ncbi:MAG: hypothetical protein K5762_07210 [Bacilli bacterium]|nr:hypothetical protein [Bacilli bacterium]